MHKFKNWQDVFCPHITALDKLDDIQNVKVSVKRDDQNHPIIQGNKLRKLKYNVRHILENHEPILVTFGGAWSNHIGASAHAALICGIQSIGFIRGEELKNLPHLWSETLVQADKNGMKLFFLSRKEYRLKHKSKEVIKILNQLKKDFFLVPEGGSNNLAIQGAEEIVSELKQQANEPTHIITACGTGGTMAGLIRGVFNEGWKTKIIGIPVLKNGMFLESEIKSMIGNQLQNWQLYTSYHFGGYGKVNSELVRFGKTFVKTTDIDLDKIYTSKVFYASYDLIQKGEIPPNSHVIILHTGGLQGGSITNTAHKVGS